MGRAPCCEKMGLKKGPWTSEEDSILITDITQNGHANWRALPKRAGLLRCGKSCRLRWMNYLRPDIKRGNFSSDEEEKIIKLHQQLGNKWSVIAARLPGRTDNEIKNVWHTHLKKKAPNKISQLELEPETQTRVTETPNSPRSDVTSLSNAADGGGAAAHAVEEMDERFWLEVLSGDDSGATSSDSFGSDLITEGGMDFWYNLFYRAEEITHLPEF